MSRDLSRSFREDVPRGLQWQQEQHGIRGRFNEAKSLIELLRLCGNSLDEYCPNTNDVGGTQYPKRGIPQKRLAETQSLVLQVDSEAAEDDHWDRIWHVPSNCVRYTISLDSPAGERIVANNSAVNTDHVGSGGAA